MPKTDYSSWSKEDLIKKITALEKRKKYGLVWDTEREPEKIVQDCQRELPVLKEIKRNQISTNKDGVTHILIEGDNYHALSVLNYTHEKAIDLIYIDPPYNTGATDWKYNNKYVDASDPYRHSKWLSLLSHRLMLAKNILKDTGIICVTIDDNELPRVWCLLEDIFKEQNHLGTLVIRNNPKGRKTERKISLIHEYALFFGRTSAAKIQKMDIAPEEKTHNYVKDKDGTWYLPTNLRKQGVDSLAVNKAGKVSDRYYPIYYDPKTGKVSTKVKLPIKILPIDKDGAKRIWRRSKDVIDEMYRAGDLWYHKTRYGDQIYFKFRGGLDGEPPESIWYEAKYSASEYGTQILDSIMGSREMFQYPKSPFAVMDCIKIATNTKNAVILDFFAGSGTTGQAVLELNKEDDGKRQFILCTNDENNICTEICYPRIQRVMQGYKNMDGETVEGLDGNLKYYKTGFVPAAPTDKNKELLTKQSVEMLTLKEGTFEKVTENDSFAIYRNPDKYTGIIFDQLSFGQFKKAVANVNIPISLYIFSLVDDDFSDDFADMGGLIKICAIPESILRVYRRIFR